MAETKLTITTNAPQVVGELKQVSEGLKDVNKEQRFIIDNAEQISKQYGKTANSIRDTQKAQQDLTVTAQQGLKREKGLIEEVEEQIAKYEKAMKKAMTEPEIEKYNRKLQETKLHLKEYNELGKTAAKTSESLTASIGKWALSLGGATVILKKLFDAFKETTGGMNLFNTVGAVTKAVLNDITTTGSFSITTLRQAILTQRVLNDLRLEQYVEGIKLADLNIKYQENYIKAIDSTLTKEEKLKAIDDALAAHNEKINIQIEHAVEMAEAIKAQIDATLVPSEKQVGEYAKLIAEIKNLDAERNASTKRLQRQRSSIIQDGIEEEKRAHDEALKNWLDAIDKTNKEAEERQRKFQDMSLKLLDDYAKSNIESLKGEERLKAERDFAIKQIKQFRDELDELGTLTDEQLKMFQAMGDNVWKAYYAGIAEAAQRVTPAQRDAISEAILGNMPDLPGLIKKDVAKAQEDIRTTLLANQEDEKHSFWELFGLDPNSDEDQQIMENANDSLKQFSDDMIGIVADALQQRVDIAQRERELLDSRIDETQREIELEADLMENGFANNLSRRQAYLEQLKAQRDKALQEEQKALKAQQLMDTILQTVNLITASTEIFKSFSKIPVVGIPLAIAMIATMFGAFASAKAKANAATKLAEGGSGSETGIVTGKKHSQGGERFLDHVEVERGEAWGVLSRPASDKYGKVFHEMVSSFNRDEMPNFMPVTNQVRVENSGPNTRLDKVIKEQRKLNESILKQPQISISGNKKVIRTGNKIRIVG